MGRYLITPPSAQGEQLTDEVGPEAPGIQDAKCLVLGDLGLKISDAGQVQEMQGILHERFHDHGRYQPSRQ